VRGLTFGLILFVDGEFAALAGADKARDAVSAGIPGHLNCSNTCLA
jgi:hypothetical protein